MGMRGRISDVGRAWHVSQCDVASYGARTGKRCPIVDRDTKHALQFCDFTVAGGTEVIRLASL